MAKGFQDLLGALLTQGLANPRMLEGAARSLGLDGVLGQLIGGKGGGLASALGGLIGGGGVAKGSDPLALTRQLAGAHTSPEADPEERAKLVLLAMILAAKADGQLGAEETQRILAKLDETDADAEVRVYVYRAMAEADDPSPLIEAARNDRALARELFATSLLAIRVDTPAESRYLSELARAFALQPGDRGPLAPGRPDLAGAAKTGSDPWKGQKKRPGRRPSQSPVRRSPQNAASLNAFSDASSLLVVLVEALPALTTQEPRLHHLP